jgi:hypothetical protein
MPKRILFVLSEWGYWGRSGHPMWPEKSTAPIRLVTRNGVRRRFEYPPVDLPDPIILIEG